MPGSSIDGRPLPLRRMLAQVMREQELLVPFRTDRYEAGDVLEYDCTGVWPEVPFRARFRVERFVGGGFAGQVYLCSVERTAGDVSRVPGISAGATVAVKLMVPPRSGARRFRNALYAIGFQSAFSPQVNRAACRAGLLWQRLAGVAARHAFGREGAVAEVYASFFDPAVGSFGEVREWVEGRTWRLEPDTGLRLRRCWRTVRPGDTGSPEYVAKRQFMAKFVKLLHDMGARELARQYEWWTMKSQPNVLKRAGSDFSPEAGLCAVDFRAGLALLPFLPMSPADFVLIARGLARGAVVQFDRFEHAVLRRFVDARRYEMPGCREAAGALIAYDAEYRRSMPDLTFRPWRLLGREARRDLRAGAASAHGVLEGLDQPFTASMRDRPARFAAFTLLGLVPLLGSVARRAWGSAAWRKHAAMTFGSPDYFRRLARAYTARCLIRWNRDGRTSDERTTLLLQRPGAFWVQRFTLGFLPAPVHSLVAEPGLAFRRVRDGWRFLLRFYRDEKFRIQWLNDLVEAGHRDGSLDDAERAHILGRVGDPFIARYLQSVAVHFATLPVTQLVSGTVGAILAVWIWLSAPPGDRSFGHAMGAFTAVVVLFQLTPISPGSICRGLYVVYLMCRDRNWRDYIVAAPLSFVKYIGYLAFPLQMAATFPVLSRFMASRWATQCVHILPVFGERGALLEHMVFDTFYNRPRAFGAWARARMKGLLDLWMFTGLVALAVVFGVLRVQPLSTAGINSSIASVALFMLPRLLFYPVLSKRSGKAASSSRNP